MNRMKRTLVIILFIFLCLGNNYAQYGNEEARNKLIYNLTHLDLNTFPDSTSLKTIENAFHYIKKSDKEIFSYIIDLSKISDAALAEDIGSHLGELLIDNTHLFLELANERNEMEQEDLATMALIMDGSGMPNEDFQKIENNLNKYILSKDSKLFSISKKYLLLLYEIKKEVNKFNE